MSANARLLSLRQLTGMTQKAFAPIIGIQQAHYSQIEKGLRPLTDAQQKELIEWFNLDDSYFEEEDLPYGVASLNYRRRQLTAKQVAMATATFGLTEQALTKGQGPINYEPFYNGPASSRRSPDQIEQFAIETRQRIGMGLDRPVNNVTRCMERLDILVAPLQNPLLDLTKIDGISTPVYRFRPFVSTLNYNVPGDRFRFSAAHELGHIVLHSSGHDGSLSDRENEADRFAAEFLMPRRVFEGLLSPDLTLNAFAQLKAQWGVSIQALIRRSFDLGFIDRERYRSLNIQIANRGWKKSEPVFIPVEKPTRSAPLFLSKLVQASTTSGPVGLENVVEIDAFRRSSIAGENTGAQR